MNGIRVYLAAICGLLATMQTVRVAAGPVVELEPTNNFFPGQNVNAAFTMNFDPRIEDSSGTNVSTSSFHVEYAGGGLTDGGVTYDFINFNVNQAGTLGIFDIDAGPVPNLASDTSLFLFDLAGNLLASSTGNAVVDTGSLTALDPFLQHSFASAGTYVLGVAGNGATAASGMGIMGPGLTANDTYTLMASLAVPEPASILLFGAGSAGWLCIRRRTARRGHR